MPRLDAQLAFLLTCDHLKGVTRQNRLLDASRDENSAEHSWHAALMALTLAEYAPTGTDVERALRLLLVHDLVEIYAGDAYIESDETLRAEQTRKEQEAARRLFGLLPEDQASAFRGLWDEFEARQTREARFARELDALAPTLLTWSEGGPGRARWGQPSAGYVAMKRRELTTPAFFKLFARWMEREGVAVERPGCPLPPHLLAQIDFLLVCDCLKGVERTTFLHDGSRPENSAEHSWHLALMALTLAEYAPSGTRTDQVVKLLLVHDLVEIYAGDLHFTATPDQLAQQGEEERRAAHALFGLLPAHQREPFQALWEEFEAGQTPEARFARALDALQPMLLTWGPGAPGCAARHPDLTRERVLRLKAPRLTEFPAFWTLAQQVAEQAVQSGILPGERETASLLPGS